MASTVREFFLEVSSIIRARAQGILRTRNRCETLTGAAEQLCRRQLRLLIFLAVADSARAIRLAVTLLEFFFYFTIFNIDFMSSEKTMSISH